MYKVSELPTSLDGKKRHFCALINKDLSHPVSFDKPGVQQSIGNYTHSEVFKYIDTKYLITNSDHEIKINALLHINALDNLRKARRNFLVKYVTPSLYSDNTANCLKKCITDWLILNGYVTSRLSSICDEVDISQNHIDKPRRTGLTDVIVIVYQYATCIDVRITNDVLSVEQKKALSETILSGARVFRAYNFQVFYDWFTALKSALPDCDALPFGPTM